MTTEPGLQIDAHKIIERLQNRIGAMSTENETLREIVGMQGEEIQQLRQQLDMIPTPDNGKAKSRARTQAQDREA